MIENATNFYGSWKKRLVIWGDILLLLGFFYGIQIIGGWIRKNFHKKEEKDGEHPTK